MANRAYQGVKSRMAIEFSGWSGNSKAFLYAYRGQEPVNTHRYYSALDIRNIRLDLLGLKPDITRPKTLPPIINVRMAKGGTGKTTIAGSVASCMSLFGHKVLMIDADPQSSLSGMFGVDWTEQDITHIGELMKRIHEKPPLPSGIEDAVHHIYDGGMLDLIPSDITMAGADGWMSNTLKREEVFVRLLEKELEFFSQYDAIVIDSAPSNSLLTTAFMVASPKIVAVVMPEPQSRKALEVLASDIQDLNDSFPGKNYDFHIVINRFNQAKKPHMDELEKVTERYASHVNDTIVRDFIGYLRDKDKDDLVGTVLEREPNSVGARDIIDLTKSLIKLYGVKIANQAGRKAA